MKKSRQLHEYVDDNSLSSLYNRVELIRQKYELQDKEIELVVETSVKIPVSIFVAELGIVEAVVKYLRENKELRNKTIAQFLNRSANNIAVAYHKAKTKHPEKFSELDSDYNIPVKMFGENISGLEAAVTYLKKSGLNLNQIASILDRNYSTVWVVYNRSKKEE